MSTVVTSGAISHRRRLFVANSLILIALGLAQLAIPSAQVASVRFAVIGDYGNNSSGEGAVASQVANWNPDLVITTGDNNYPSGAAATIDTNIGKYYQAFIHPYVGAFGPGSDVNRFFPTLGNHDWGDVYPNPSGWFPYRDYFTLPGNERYYEFVQGPVHFFALDSDRNEPDGNSATSIQAAWLQSRLAASTARWKLVYFHHAAYSSGSNHGSSTWMQWPFAQWGVNGAVIGGHDHLYERLNIGGLLYFVNGSGGGGLYGFRSTPLPGSEVRYNADYGAQLVDADDTSIRFQFINRLGVVIDDFTIGSVAPALAPPFLTATAASSSRIDLNWGDPGGEIGFRIERSGDGVNFAQIAVVGENVTSYADTGLQSNTTYYYRVFGYNAGGNSPPSPTGSATTFASPPNAPTGLTARGLSASQITLSWSDTATDEDGFRIERGDNGSNYVEIAVMAPDATTYTDNNLPRNTRFYYRLRAFNEVGNSAYSNTASAKTRNR